MAVDLTISKVFNRESVLIDDDCLIVLDHGGNQDRVHKVYFDRVESVIVWRTLPWGRMLLMLVLFGIPIIPLITNEAYPFAYVLAPILLLIEVYYINCRVTHIRIFRAGTPKDLVVITRPGKVGSFLTRLRINIQKTQNEAMKHAEALHVERSKEDVDRFASHAESQPASPEPGGEIN